MNPIIFAGMLPVIVIPLMALIKVCQVGCSGQNLKRLFRPEEDWDIRAGLDETDQNDLTALDNKAFDD